METNAFASLAVFKLPSTCRLLASSCCPDKDLVVLISRLGGKDRISLWKIQGSKKWEVDVGTDESKSEEVVGLTWSPDGMIIPSVPPRSDALSRTKYCYSSRSPSHYAPFNSGWSRRALFVGQRTSQYTETFMSHHWRLVVPRRKGLCQQTHSRYLQKGSHYRAYVTSFDELQLPCLTEVKTGTAHSILRTLPLLDHIQEHSQKLTLVYFLNLTINSDLRTALLICLLFKARRHA